MVAIVAIEVTISLTPVLDPGAVIARRVLLWACLGALISVAAHGLRDRIRRAQDESERLQGRLRDLTVIEDRDRIAADLQDKVIQRIFTAGMALQSAASLATQQEVRQRLGTAIGELDHAVHTLRDAVFGRELAALHDRAAEAGLSIDVQPIPGGTRLAWQMPLT